MTKSVTISELINIQHACNDPLPVNDETILQWLSLFLESHCKVAELNIRLVCVEEITQLNQNYRNKPGATNVLAFPFSNLPKGLVLDFEILGDVVISPKVVLEESLKQHKTFVAHFAHILIHGSLHLLGYDHENDKDTKIMQNLEIEFLNMIGFSNPYVIEED